MNCKIPPELRGKELHKFLKDNKHLLIAEKKMDVKKSDCLFFPSMHVNEKGELSEKSNLFIPDQPELTTLYVKSVINTTNLLDSHMDVHLPGLWKKSIRENKNVYLCEDHNLTFRGIIADGVKASTETKTWKELGYKAAGSTEALIFDSVVKRDRNEFMFHEYRRGHVKNHSVGMRYVTIYMCVNEPEDKYWKEEFEAWEKYFPQIINPEIAEEWGYFWAVTEAKIVEGSAVPLGSNWVTPTLENNNKSAETSDTEEKEPPVSTPIIQPSTFDLDAAIKTTKIFIPKF